MDFNVNQITAEEAYLIASGEHENQMNKRIEEDLHKIYSRIHSAVKDGDMDVDVSFYIIHSKQILSSILEEKGFKISFGYNEYDGEEYINISWKHIGNKQ